MTATRLALRAPAKVNLTLRCLGKRADGYHEIETAMLALDLADELAIAARPGARRVSIAVAGDPDVPADATNLAARAAAAVLDRAGADLDLDLALEKRVPSGAGLGGGSSDAAAAALGAARLAGLDPEAALPALAALGSDCAFFLAARASGFARCAGRGERVEPLPPLARRWSVLLVTPDVAAPTARVYGAWRPEDADPPRPALDPRTTDERALRAALANDLERAALRAVPGLAAWRALLDALGLAHARLAGSGASFFAVFADPEEAARAARATAAAAESLGRRPRLVRAVGTAEAGVEVSGGNRYG